jgi:hypothetical protein
MSDKIKTHYTFEEGNLSISFDKILLITAEICEPEELPEEFQTMQEDFYNLAIKQENAANPTRLIVAESTYKSFEEFYFIYLDYKLDNSPITNEVNAKFLKDASDFFSKLEVKIDETLSNVTAKSQEQITYIRKESLEILNKVDLFNKDLSSNLDNLKELNSSLENFVLEEDEVETVTGELLEKEKEKEEEIIK